MVVRRGNIGDENEGGCNGEFDASVMERLGMVNVLGCFAFPEDIINYAPTAYCWETHKALEPGHVFMPLYITSWCQDLALRCFPYPVFVLSRLSSCLFSRSPEILTASSFQVIGITLSNSIPDVEISHEEYLPRLKSTTKCSQIGHCKVIQFMVMAYVHNTLLLPDLL